MRTSPITGRGIRTWRGVRCWSPARAIRERTASSCIANHPTRPALWDALMSEGGGEGLKPCGLGARDTLRTEMKFALYGNDIDESTHPLEAGLGWVVKYKAGDFVGREKLLALKAEGVKRKLVGFEMVDRGIPRHGAPVLIDGEVAGEVTSGTMSPSLGKAIGIGYVPASNADEGAALEIDIRGKARRAQIVKTPFYKKS